MVFCLKLTAIMMLLAGIFLASGWIANSVLLYTGCLWTSSGTFGLSFIGISAVIVNLINSFIDVTSLFE